MVHAVTVVPLALTDIFFRPEDRVSGAIGVDQNLFDLGALDIVPRPRLPVLSEPPCFATTATITVYSINPISPIGPIGPKRMVAQ